MADLVLLADGGVMGPVALEAALLGFVVLIVIVVIIAIVVRKIENRPRR